jgi:hypothetical protein
MQLNVPCIALIEDIDNVFHGRENISRKHGMMSFLMASKKKDGEADQPPPSPLTFDCLLNCLDGVDRCDGVFTIVTTNSIDKIDPALGQPRKLPDGTVEFISSRPGRIDKAGWSRKTRNAWPGGFWANTRRNTWRCSPSSTSTQISKKRRPSSRNAAPR